MQEELCPKALGEAGREAWVTTQLSNEVGIDTKEH